MNLSTIIITIVVAFLITVLLSRILIPLLKRLNIGQSIREDGPESHLKKSGTPTMGGLMIIISIVATSLIIVSKFVPGPIGIEVWLLLFALVGYGMIGFL